jgi:peptide/nickel transport system substrate-binding protein
MRIAIGVFTALCLASVATAPLSAQTGGAQPRRGGTAVAVIDTNPPSLNVAISNGATENRVAATIFGSLVWIDRKWQPQPYLAESWTVGQDQKSYTFKLRRNVKWHDGKPFTAADVQYTFQEVLAKYHPSSKAVFDRVTAVETPDPHTVVVKLKQPFGPFLQLMTVWSAPILPRHLYEGTDVLKSPHNLKPVGTGPFKFHEWTRGDRIVVVRNDDYFEPGQPYLDRIVFKMIPDVHARTIALETGEVDYVQDYFFGKEDYARLSKVKGLVFEADADVPANELLMFNVRKAPLGERKVRQALAHAIDRKLLVERVNAGLGNPGHSAIDSRLTWAHNPEVDYEKLYPYNVARANALLDEAGFARKPDGTRFPLRLTFDVRRAGFARTAEVIRDQLRAVGIPVQLEGVERADMVDKVFMNWDFDMTIQNLTTGGDPAIGVQRIYLCKDVRKAPFVNATGYCNKEVDELFERGASSADPAERGTAYRKAQVLLAQDIPTLVLTEKAIIDAASGKLRGLWQSRLGYTFWAPAWMAE